MGQRLDIELDVPGEGGAFPILALREGAKERTGVILATPGAAVTRIAEMSEADHPAFSGDLAQEGSAVGEVGRALNTLLLRVDHAMTPRDLVRTGSDIESQVLARAVRRHVEHRILLNGHKTVVFR